MMKAVFVDGVAWIAIGTLVYFIGKLLIPEYIKVFRGIADRRATQVRTDEESDQ